MDLPISVILEQWGRSREVNSAYHLDYPHETPFNRMRRSPGRGTVSAAGLEDETYLAVDRAVSQLTEPRKTVIVMWYLGRAKHKHIAQRVGISHQAINGILLAGEQEVLGHLEKI